MKLAILGFGREGKSVLKFLKRSPRYRRAEISIIDQKLDKNYLKNLARFDLIFRSPGVPYNLPELVRARKNRVKFSSATKLFFEFCPCPIIGVTGTKGKGTVSTLLYQIFKAAGKDIYLVGNIGRPALDYLPKLKKSFLVVFELSSFQLQDLDRSPQISVMLDIFPDHQDHHRSWCEYYTAKQNIFRYQKRDDLAFRMSESPKNFSLFKPSDLRLIGEHNFRNAVMAAVVAQSLGVPSSVITKVVKRFRGLPHRLQFVRRIGRTSFYDDSAATNPTAAASAIGAFAGQPLLLIAGGQGKGLDYAPLARAVRHSAVKVVFLFGQERQVLARALRSIGIKIISVETLEQTFEKILSFISEVTVVLLSPGAASLDQFRDYIARGDKFQELVRRL